MFSFYSHLCSPFLFILCFHPGGCFILQILCDILLVLFYKQRALLRYLSYRYVSSWQAFTHTSLWWKFAIELLLLNLQPIPWVPVCLLGVYWGYLCLNQLSVYLQCWCASYDCMGIAAVTVCIVLGFSFILISRAHPLSPPISGPPSAVERRLLWQQVCDSHVCTRLFVCARNPR